MERRIHWLPTALTLGNSVCGFASVAVALHAAGRVSNEGWLTFAAGLVFGGMIFDILDGRIASLTRSDPRFGAQIDALSDMVTFGLAPAALMVSLLERRIVLEGPLAVPLPIAAAPAAVYVCCAALRLARHSVHAEELGRGLFAGLPSPAAAGVIASLALLAVLGGPRWLPIDLGRATSALVPVMPLVVLGLSLLMVTRIRFVHVGEHWLRGGRGAVVIAIAAAFILVAPAVSLFLLFAGYLVGGLLSAVGMLI